MEPKNEWDTLLTIVELFEDNLKEVLFNEVFIGQTLFFDQSSQLGLMGLTLNNRFASIV